MRQSSKEKEFAIREFRMEDYSEVVRLWKTSGIKLRPGDKVDAIRVKLRRDPELFLVAVNGNEMIGSVMGAWDGRRGWIYHLAVNPKFQRRGVASVLLKELETRMKAKGIIKVNALIYKWNETSRRFFETRGFEIDEEWFAGKSLTA